MFYYFNDSIVSFFFLFLFLFFFLLCPFSCACCFSSVLFFFKGGSLSGVFTRSSSTSSVVSTTESSGCEISSSVEKNYIYQIIIECLSLFGGKAFDELYENIKNNLTMVYLHVSKKFYALKCYHNSRPT